MSPLLLGLFLIPLSRAETPQALFERANEAALKGDHAAAEAGYRDLLAAGHQDGDLLYNLGNTLYRQGDLGLALVAWRRAQVLSPRDPDLGANLERGRTATKDRLEPVEIVPTLLFWQRSLSIAEGRLLAALGLGLSLSIAAWRRWRQDAGWSSPLAVGGVLSALLGIVLAAGVLWVEAGLRRQPPAIVLAEEIVARSGLGTDGVDLFRLHEGAEVRVLERAPGWALIGLEDERRGWVPEALVATILPTDPFPQR